MKHNFPEVSKKLKIHLFLHLTDNMMDFGPTSSFNTERLVCRKKHKNFIIMHRCESFNSLMRARNIFANRLAPSRDIAKGFEVLETLRSVCAGSDTRYSNRKMSTIGSYCCLCTFMSVCMCVCALVLAVDSNVYISHHQYSVILMGFPLKNFLRRRGYTSMESYER